MRRSATRPRRWNGPHERVATFSSGRSDDSRDLKLGAIAEATVATVVAPTNGNNPSPTFSDFDANRHETPMALYDSILDTIGRTPIVKLHRLPPKHVSLYAKVESFNPGGSVKDRLALAIVLDAERSGALKPGQTIVEATSGNTGVALALVAAARGYPFVAVMTETFSIERRKLMRAYGAKVILTPAAERGSGMVRKAAELAERHGWFLARQFENPANPAYHRSTTAPEILQDFAGRRLDYFVSGWGTGGTLTGVGQVLKVARPDVRIVTSEPAGASLLAGKDWQPHKIQGWTPDFVPAVLDRSVADEIVPIDDVLARDTARRLATEEGLFVGISAGATVAAALQVAASAPEGAVLLATLPDTGERYLSTFLFEGVEDGSDDAWLASLDAQSRAA
jgi:cysteine synthase A